MENKYQMKALDECSRTAPGLFLSITFVCFTQKRKYEKSVFAQKHGKTFSVVENMETKISSTSWINPQP